MRALAVIALVALVALVAACHAPRGEPAIARPPLGLAVSVFAPPDGGPSLAIVDDRRALVVDRDRRVALPDLAADVELTTLAFESLDPDHALAIGACTRALLDATTLSPAVTCTTQAAPGTYRVRVTYVSREFAVLPTIDVTLVAPDRATVASRITIAGPTWMRPATIEVFDAVHRATRLAREDALLDGSVAIVAASTREVPARLRRIYDPAKRADHVADLVAAPVWVWLELDGALPGGAVRVHAVEDGVVHEAVVGADARHATAQRVGLRAWIDPALHVGRERTTMSPVEDRVALSIANRGEVARELWLEEPVRSPGAHVVNPFPAGTTPVLGAHGVRVRHLVAPATIDRLWFTLAYPRP